jgi:hypothetical protein
MRKYYSVPEAEENIPALRPKLLNLIKLSKAIDFLESVEIQYDDEYETIKQDVSMNKKFHELSLKFCKEVERLLQQGVVLKDIDNGLVNFFALHEGKEIFLCWKLGEDRIESWYELASDYSFKRPVSELKNKKHSL